MANKAKLELIASMFIFGTIGIFVRHIPLPSSMIALARGFVGAFFVLLFVYLKKSKLDKAAIKKNLYIFMCIYVRSYNLILFPKFGSCACCLAGNPHR